MTQREMPKLGFGTYGRTGAEGVDAILAALEAGYRHLDTAQSYGTEGMVGEAVRRSGLPRDEVFLTTKIDMANYGAGRLVPSLRESLDRLGVERADLTLLHWPSPNGELPLPVYLDQIAQAKAEGLTREIGVSNFPIALLDEAIERLGAGEIAVNQVELNPWFRNRRLADHCAAVGVTVTCYQPIAKGRLGEDPEIAAIAAAHGATPEQVALAWELANGWAAIPTSSRADRIRSNFAALDLSLSREELDRIDGLDRGARSIDPEWGPDWD